MHARLMTASAFEWSEVLETGLPTVDDQHRQLVHLINAFGELVTHELVEGERAVEAILADLADYADYHFRDEEHLFRNACISPRHVQEHHAEHAEFLAEIQRRQGDLGTKDADGPQSLLNFLCHWLTYHILGSDHFMARQLAAIRDGVPADVAYHELQRVSDPATNTLLKALNGLFREVSARNHALQELNQSLEAKVAERTRELSKANERLQAIALTDALTGLPNRRHALIEFAAAWSRTATDGKPLSCMMIDADGFKQINDTYGHDAGDAVLRRLSRELANSVRTDDFVARLGGDEFFVICPDTSLDGALRLAEQIRSAVQNLRVSAGAGLWNGSISVGVATRIDTMTDTDALIRSADEAVYVAKRRGRNCVATTFQT